MGSIVSSVIILRIEALVIFSNHLYRDFVHNNRKIMCVWLYVCMGVGVGVGIMCVCKQRTFNLNS